MATVSQAFAEKARELYPDEGQLHAYIAEGAGVQIRALIHEITERDLIPGSLSHRPGAASFTPLYVLDQLNALGDAGFRTWLETHCRAQSLMDAWWDELHENTELDNELADASEQGDSFDDPYPER